MNRLLYWITGRLPCRIISDGGKPYLERYYLGTFAGARHYLHRFVGSDPDRGLHDHPWRWAVSFILLGWYWEENRYGTKKVRWINRLTGDSFHRVVLNQVDGVPQPVWTLFIHRAERVKPWGFLRPNSERSATYHHHHYGKDELGRDEQWWKTAPAGRFEPRRMS